MLTQKVFTTLAPVDFHSLARLVFLLPQALHSFESASLSSHSTFTQYFSVSTTIVCSMFPSSLFSPSHFNCDLPIATIVYCAIHITIRFVCRTMVSPSSFQLSKCLAMAAVKWHSDGSWPNRHSDSKGTRFTLGLLLASWLLPLLPISTSTIVCFFIDYSRSAPLV